MNSSNGVLHHCREGAQADVPQATKRGRPPLRWSDIWNAPLHDFPIRDEIFYQYLPLSKQMKILEVGPGSGFTAFRLARQVQNLTLVEVAEEAAADLRNRLGHLPNVLCVRADVTQPGLPERLGQDFDAVFSLDVFEYLVDPEMCLRNLAAVLRPNGELFLTYPNVPPPGGDGVTWFNHRAELDALLAKAGFCNWQIFAVRMRPLAAGVYGLLHEWPLRMYRKLRPGDKKARPQTYEATWAFQHRQRLLGYKVPLHMYWTVIALGLRLVGDVFSSQPVTDEILGQQIVIRAWR